MRIAIAQVRSSVDKSKNLEKALDYIAKAKELGASIVAFPEFLMAYSPKEQSAKELYAIAESIDGKFTKELVNASKEHNIAIIASIYERSDVKYKVYDTALFIKDRIRSVYRKLHLYDALGFKESIKLIAGSELPRIIRYNNISMSMFICYDVRFPELARLLASKAKMLIIPSAWVAGENKVEHWKIMLRARAIENGCYVIAPDQVGNIYIGKSMVIDPLGNILLDMNDKEGIDAIDIDLKMVDEVRSRLPLLKNRRLDVYSLKPNKV